MLIHFIHWGQPRLIFSTIVCAKQMRKWKTHQKFIRGKPFGNAHSPRFNYQCLLQTSIESIWGKPDGILYPFQAGGGRGEDFYLIHAAKSPKGVLCFEKQTAKSCIHSKHKAGGGRGRIFKGSVRAKNHLMSDLFHDVILPTLQCTYYSHTT